VSLSGTAQAQPNYWLNVKTGVNYQVITQTPQYRIDSVDALGTPRSRCPISRGTAPTNPHRFAGTSRPA